MRDGDGCEIATQVTVEVFLVATAVPAGHGNVPPPLLPPSSSSIPPSLLFLRNRKSIHNLPCRRLDVDKRARRTLLHMHTFVKLAHVVHAAFFEVQGLHSGNDRQRRVHTA